MKAIKRGMIAAIAATFAWGAAGIANAEPVNEENIDHVYIDDEYVFAESMPTDKSTTASEVDLGPSQGYDLSPSLLPSQGETVIVHYTNATQTIVAPTASCTQSATASTPYKTGSYAAGKVNLKRSSGCSGTWEGNDQMNFKNLVGLWASGSSSTVSKLGPSANTTKLWNSTCKGSRSTTWVTIGSMWYQSLETSSSSAQVKLSCTS